MIAQSATEFCNKEAELTTRFRVTPLLSFLLLCLAILFSPSIKAQTKVNPNQIAGGSNANNITWTGNQIQQNGFCQRTQNIRCVDSANNAGWSGSTADAWLNAAIADLPATGGIVDARGLGATTQTIANTVTVGSSTREVTLLLDKMTQFNIKATGGVAAFVLWGSNSIIATGGINPAGSRAQFQVTSGANISNVIKTQPTTGAVFLIKGLSFGVQSGATITDSIINFTGAVQGSVIQDVNVGALFQANYTGLKVGFCSNLLIINFNSTSVNQPAVFSASVSQGIQNVVMIGGILVHQGGNPALTIDGTGGTLGATSGFTVMGTQFESNNTSDTGVLIKNAVNVHLEGLQFSVSTNAGSDAIKIIDSATITGNIVADNIYMVNAWTHTINDTINNFTSTNSRITHYALAESSGNPQTNYWEGRADGFEFSIGADGSKAKRFKLTDQGQCTMSSGACTAQPLGSTYTTAPLCTATWTGNGMLAGTIKITSNATTVTPSSSTATDTAQVNWFCFGN